MNDPLIPYRVEPMLVEDLEAVMAIEQVAHAAPWPASAYRHELEQNDLAHYIVLLPGTSELAGSNGLGSRVLGWLRRPRRGRVVIGYGGFWLMAGEAHISTIAMDPEWRGLGLGELLLVELIERALELKAEMVTLEVRISNETAQNLYGKYQFEITGTRKRYYRNNNEDAHIMTVEGVQSPAYRAFLDEQWRLLRPRLATKAQSH
jgi:[ribosomal protein S18]-alanine N-acetyltransferase